MNSFAYVKTRYKMPFLKRGLRANMNGRGGVITAGDGGYLRMRFDDAKYSMRVHPQWAMTFYDDNGKIIADYKTKGEQGA